MKSIRLISIAFVLSAALSYTNFANAQCTGAINSFPYLQDFESTNGGWTPGGTASQWSWGTPIKPVISGAASGSKCWITGTLTQPSYSNNQNSTLTSPCFDFSGLTAPYISFNVFWETEKKYDGASFQYSIDGGNTWTTLGAYADYTACPGTNWYNTNGITVLGTDGWSGNIQPTAACAGGAGNGSGAWKQAQHAMPSLAGKSNVRFRFRFGAGNVCNNYDGFAIDDIRISEAPSASADFNFNCLNATSASFQASSTICNPSYSWDFGDPASGSANVSTSPQPTHSFSSPGQYLVALSLLNAPAGTAAITKSITITDVNIQLLTPIKCAGDKAAIEALVTPVGNYTFQWNTLPVLTTPAISGLDAGTYSVSVSAANTCSNQDQITIPPGAVLNVFLGNDTVLCTGEQLLLDAGSFASFRWQDGSANRQFIATQTGLYFVEVSDANGCSASDSIKLTIDCTDLFFPTAFTPNQDGKNDRFGAFGNIAGVSDYRLRVFNRWGQIVFQTSNALDRWDGKLGGKNAGTQTLVWFAEYTIQATGLRKRQKGTVTLMR